MVWEIKVQSQVKSYQRLKKKKKKKKKRYLMPLCLTLSIIRYGSRVNWSNPGNGVAPFPTPWCSRYWKRSLWVALDYGCQLSLYGLKYNIWVSLPTVVEGSLKASFSIILPYTFPWIAPLTVDPFFIMLCVKQRQFFSLWYDYLGLKPQSPGPLANTLTIMPIIK